MSSEIFAYSNMSLKTIKVSLNINDRFDKSLQKFVFHNGLLILCLLAM